MTQSEQWTIGKLLDWTSNFFREKQIDSPRLDAEILLAHCLACKRINLYLMLDQEVDSAHRGQFRELVKKRGDRVPVAYLVGERDFYGQPFAVSPAVLIPRPETELIIEHVNKLYPPAPKRRIRSREVLAAEAELEEQDRLNQNPLDSSAPPLPTATQVNAPSVELPLRNILDLGTGSGILAITLAQRYPNARVFAVDISADAIEVARNNADRHQVADRVTFLVGDLFDPLTSTASSGSAQRGGSNSPTGRVPFDLIVSNPPYVAEADRKLVDPETKFEPQQALFAGNDGLDVIRRLIAQAPEWLVSGGQLMIEFGINQADKIEQLFQANGQSATASPGSNDQAKSLWRKVRIIPDLERKPRLVIAERA